MKRIALLLLALLAAAPAHAQSSETVIAVTTNRSVTITTGNTFQTAIAAVTQSNLRRSLTIQNNNASDSCWIYLGSGTPTKATSIILAAGGAYTRYYPYVPADAVQVTCATTADTLYIDTQ